jgi:hypothetical protein
MEMVLLAFKGARPPVQNTAFEKREGELMAFCPSCKSFETIWFDDGRLLSTRKFRQQGNLIFHDCGSVRPCRLYRNS